MNSCPAMHHDGDQVKIEIADWSGLPDAQVLRTELRGVLSQAIAELPDTYRPVLLLRDVGGAFHRRNRASARPFPRTW